jgi:hypothetical protein
MTYATTDQVATGLGRLPESVPPSQMAQWEQWLGDVESDIAAEFRRRGLSLTERVDAGDPSADAVARVERDAVIRKIQNPTGDTSTTVSVDDASVTRRKEGVATALGLDLTDAEWDRLLPVLVSDAFSTRPGFAPDRCLGMWP